MIYQNQRKNCGTLISKKLGCPMLIILRVLQIPISLSGCARPSPAPRSYSLKRCWSGITFQSCNRSLPVSWTFLTHRRTESLRVWFRHLYIGSHSDSETLFYHDLRIPFKCRAVRYPTVEKLRRCKTREKFSQWPAAQNIIWPVLIRNWRINYFIIMNIFALSTFFIQSFWMAYFVMFQS